MEDPNVHHKCPSVDPHPHDAVRDRLLHYFGCLEIAERVDFLRPSHAFWESERKLEKERADKIDPGGTRNSDSGKCREKLCAFAISLEAEYKRIDILREAISNDSRNKNPDRTNSRISQVSLQASPEHKYDLPGVVRASHKAWKNSEVYRANIGQVRSWRMKQKQGKDTTAGDVTAARALPPPKDVDRPQTETVEKHRQGPFGGFLHKYRKNQKQRVETAASAAQTLIADDQSQTEAMERLERGHIQCLIEECRNKHGKKTETAASPVQALTAGDQSRTRTCEQMANSDGRPIEYELENDVFARVIFYQMETERSEPQTQPRGQGQGRTASEVQFQGADLGHGGVMGQFPDQRLSVRDLLDEKKSILKETIPGDTKHLEYYHIPYNNMSWVEEAIRRYCERDSKPGAESGHRVSNPKAEADLILRSKYWRGQQRGGNSAPVHARHMRPLCEAVDGSPSNVVLFMPFLHWETDRKREKLARLAEVECLKQTQKSWEKEAEQRKRRKKQRDGLPPCALPKVTHSTEDSCARLLSDNRNGVNFAHGLLRDVGDVVDHFREGKEVDGLVRDPETSRLKVKNELGQFLLDAANLFEAMSTFRDKRLLERYLHCDPPLHPRRTLDQSYYWTLRSTKARDRDQVVYRGTHINQDIAHKFRKQAGSDKKKISLLPGSGNDECVWRWTMHSEYEDEFGCDHCRNDIRKVSRVMMVDQLWMWILDEQTIITSFPRRYGMNKQDTSGVHKSIRLRLKYARKDQIRSIFDLALVILEECTNIFFDCTKFRDDQPPVMDIFAEAIGDVTHKQTVLFQHLWHWTQKASGIYRSNLQTANTSDLHVPLVDINPEAKLQREIKDIIDELDIMIHLSGQQRDVIKRFVKQVHHIMDPGRIVQESTAFINTEGDAGQIHGEEEREETEKRTREPRNPDSRSPQFTWFKLRALDLLSEVDDRVGELEVLKKSAQSTAQDVNEILALKQQQASVVQAWQSVKQSDEAVKQGSTLMIFTSVTIIFLPLSFMSSVFGMNNSNFTPENWTSSNQFRLIFPISFGLILFTFIITYSRIVRSLAWTGYKFAWWLIVHLGMYRFWLWLRRDWDIQKLLEQTEKDVMDMKGAVQKARKDAKRQRRETTANKADGAVMSDTNGKGSSDGGGTRSSEATRATRTTQNSNTNGAIQRHGGGDDRNV